jgi:hypothetical protein
MRKSLLRSEIIFASELEVCRNIETLRLQALSESHPLLMRSTKGRNYS